MKGERTNPVHFVPFETKGGVRDRLKTVRPDTTHDMIRNLQMSSPRGWTAMT